MNISQLYSAHEASCKGLRGSEGSYDYLCRTNVAVYDKVKKISHTHFVVYLPESQHLARIKGVFAIDIFYTCVEILAEW